MKSVRAAELMEMLDNLFETEGMLPVLGCISDALFVAVDRYQYLEPPADLSQRAEYFATYDAYVVAAHLVSEVLKKLHDRTL
jgi:hypothetical protein